MEEKKYKEEFEEGYIDQEKTPELCKVINKEVRQKTPAQEVLINKIMKSGKILDKEYRALSEMLSSRVVTSYDAAVFIEYVLGMLKFRRHFYNGKHKAYKKCYSCKSRDDIRKYWYYDEAKNVWLCENCALNIGTNHVVPVKEQEAREVAADFQRKNGYPELTPAEEESIFRHKEE